MVTTEDVLAAVAGAPQNWGAGRRRWLAETMASLGATDDELVAAVLPVLDDGDRNARVKALWVLSLASGPAAADGILRGLRDPVRRVREVALKCVRPHHDGSAEVWEEVRAIAEDVDGSQTKRLRQLAFFVLSAGVVEGDVPDVAEDAFRAMLDSERFRRGVLLRLCFAREQSPASRAVLHELVRSGAKEEAVLATRALCGHRLVRVDGRLPPEVRRRVRGRYDPAPDVYGGVSLYWVPTAEADAIVEEGEGA